MTPNSRSRRSRSGQTQRRRGHASMRHCRARRVNRKERLRIVSQSRHLLMFCANWSWDQSGSALYVARDEARSKRRQRYPPEGARPAVSAGVRTHTGRLSDFRATRRTTPTGRSLYFATPPTVNSVPPSSDDVLTSNKPALLNLLTSTYKCRRSWRLSAYRLHRSSQ